MSECAVLEKFAMWNDLLNTEIKIISAICSYLIDRKKYGSRGFNVTKIKTRNLCRLCELCFSGREMSWRQHYTLFFFPIFILSSNYSVLKIPFYWILTVILQHVASRLTRRSLSCNTGRGGWIRNCPLAGPAGACVTVWLMYRLNVRFTPQPCDR